MERCRAIEGCGYESLAALCMVFRVCCCEPVGCAVAVRIRMEDIEMQLKNGCMAVKLMEFVGLCARHTLEVGTPREQGVQFEDLLERLL